jgi:tetratricopeptide (TPR) repeat protein
MKMENFSKQTSDFKLDCHNCRERLPAFTAQSPSLEERQSISIHLFECEECLSVYADLENRKAGEDRENSLYVGDRPLWGPLTWGVEEDEEYMQELLYFARSAEKDGGFILVKHHPIQEKSLFLLFCALSVQLRRECKQVLFASPSIIDTLVPLLDEAKEPALYLLAPEGTQATDFDLFLQALAFHNRTKLGKVVAVIGAGPEYGKEEEPEGPLDPAMYTIPSPDMDGELARFERRLSEEVAAIREELTKVDAVTSNAYALVALLDAWNISMPLALLARLLDLTQAEAIQVVNQARDLLFWVDFPSEGSKELVSTAASTIARQFLPLQKEELENAYVSLIEAASQEQARLLIVRLLRRLIQQGRVMLARELIRRCRGTLTALWQGANAQEHVLYGKVLVTLGELEEAEKIYRQGYDRDSTNPYLLHALAVVASKTTKYGDWKEVERYFKELLLLPGQQENPYLWQAWAEQARRRGLSKAEEYYQKALALDANNLPTLVGYANLELERGKGHYGESHRQHAEELLLQARAIDYRNVYALHSLGMLEKERAKYATQALPHLQEATHYLQTVLRIDPYNLPALNALATLEKERGHLQQAEEYLEQALAIDEENLHCLTAWGELWTSIYSAFQCQDAAEEAERAFQRAEALDEKNVHALVGYARLLSLLQRYEEAEAHLKQVVNLPGRTEETMTYVSMVRGEIAALQGDSKRASDEFAAAWKKGAIAASTALAKVLAPENLSRALRWLKKAREYEPNNVIIYNTEAAIEAEYGDKAKACVAFEKSLAIDPENTYTHWRYAQLLEREGKQEKARLHYQQADDLGFLLKGESQMNTDEAVLNDDTLYERYGKPLEQKDHGKYIAISRDGQVIVDADDMVVVSQAIQRFGSGNFMFHRIGYSYVDKLRRGHADQYGLSVS